jgi:hypothetical protein
MNVTQELESIMDMNQEWEQWQQLIKELEETGAVTKADLAASPFEPFDTPGKQLLETVRQWGERLAELRIAQQ